MKNESEIKEIVRNKYSEIARSGTICTAVACCPGRNFGCVGNYDHDLETSNLTAELFQSSLGCGNPFALASLKEGEIVLDLGSGAGLDALLGCPESRSHRQGLRHRHDCRNDRISPPSSKTKRN